jgi:L-alanine-DL-glutamate epimerase-like enolase superfamily enzyme
MAEAYQLPIAPHDCVGPITLVAAVHLDYAVPNVFIQEVVRAYLHGVYPNLVTDLPKVEDGAIRPLEGPGLGTALLPDLRARPDANVRITRAN